MKQKHLKLLFANVKKQKQTSSTIQQTSLCKNREKKTEVSDGEEIVDVFFENGGLKKLVASLAKLDVIEG